MKTFINDKYVGTRSKRKVTNSGMAKKDERIFHQEKLRIKTNCQSNVTGQASQVRMMPAEGKGQEKLIKS